MKQRDIEVDEEAERIPARSKIPDQLGGVNIEHALDGFQLHDDEGVDDDTKTLSDQVLSLVAQRDRNLALDGVTGQFKIVNKRFLVESFEQTGP
jgi:hypothetical protein